MIGTQISLSVVIDNVSGSFHLYQLYWTKDRISVFVDNKLYFTYKKPQNNSYSQWPFDNSFNIILNTAVGGSWGGINGVDKSIFPQQYVIDYVRHFAIKP
jgi:beta-glucanase (GH16 family)